VENSRKPADRLCQSHTFNPRPNCRRARPGRRETVTPTIHALREDHHEQTTDRAAPRIWHAGVRCDRRQLQGLKQSRPGRSARCGSAGSQVRQVELLPRPVQNPCCAQGTPADEPQRAVYRQRLAVQVLGLKQPVGAVGEVGENLSPLFSRPGSISPTSPTPDQEARPREEIYADRFSPTSPTPPTSPARELRSAHQPSMRF
jgi:hypothetical protein